jgi:hypothetical protein
MGAAPAASGRGTGRDDHARCAQSVAVIVGRGPRTCAAEHGCLARPADRAYIPLVGGASVTSAPCVGMTGYAMVRAPSKQAAMAGVDLDG